MSAPMTSDCNREPMIARPYQTESVESVERAFGEFSKVLGVAATGAGKTIVFSMFTQRHLAERAENRVLIIAHREELLSQAAQKLMRATGIESELERADARASLDARVVVASIQTLCRRFERFPANHFTRIIVDEAHHALANSYQPTLQYFLGGGAKVLGVTATPGTKGKKALGNFFETIAFEVGLIELIRAGYLSPISVKSFPLIGGGAEPISFTVKNGDYDQEQVDHALDPYLESVVARLGAEIGDRKTLVFLPLIKTVERFVALCNAAGIKAAGVSGVSEERANILSAHGTDFQILANSMLLCLDMQTEILTARGWVNHSTISTDDLVANWSFDGTVFFARPEEIVKRPLSESEHMVSVKSLRNDIRVTNTHRMIVGRGERNYGWKKVPANQLRAGHNLPSCGVAEPLDVRIDDPVREASRRRICGNAYNLRKLNGVEYGASFVEAKKRETARVSMRRKQPHELSLDECHLIGFWIADGSVNRALLRGGLEYTLCQSPNYPFIVKWIDDLIARLGLSSCRRVKEKSPKAIIWSLCRGTGGGSQARAGVYSIEPYLQKNGTHLFWGLNESQFDALAGGYWMGDGHHGQAEHGIPKSLVANDTKRPWIELLCAIGSVRGWRCSVTHLPSQNPKHLDQWRIRMVKTDRMILSKKSNITHEPFAPEDVWCVKTTSKNIITRRGGKVTVMGNTEGYDDPAISAMMILRPTRSEILFSQMVGRGTRVYCPWGCTERCTHGSRKRNLLLLDPLWLHEDMNLVRPANLVSGRDEDRRSMSERVAAKQEELDLLNMLADAEHEREKSLAEKLARMEKRKTKTISVEEWAVLAHAPNIADFEPTMKWHESPISPKQAEMLVRFGFDAGSVRGRGHASALLDVFFSRRKQGLATVAQVRLMTKMKHPNPDTETFAGAKAWLDQRFSKTTK